MKQNVLVTGGCGFIGSHIVDRLLLLGFQVIVIDNLSTGSLINLNDKAIFFQIDASDKEAVDKLFEQYSIEYVIHQAAKINTNALHECPLTDVETTLQTTLVLAEAAIRHNVRNFIFASSVAVYGKPSQIPVSESTGTNPIYSYGIAKAAAEKYLEYFNRYHGLNYQVLRYANVFGPRQPVYGEVGVIAIFTQRFLTDQPFVVYGAGEHLRDYIYVSDVVEFTTHAMRMTQPGSYNVGRGLPVSVNEVLEVFKSLAVGDLTVSFQEERFGELGDFCCDTKLALETGWSPIVSLDHGIKFTIQHYEDL